MRREFCDALNKLLHPIAIVTLPSLMPILSSQRQHYACDLREWRPLFRETCMAALLMSDVSVRNVEALAALISSVWLMFIQKHGADFGPLTKSEA
jgi:hypothetical protein